MVTDQEMDKGLVVLKVIWFAMLMSLAVYLLVAFLLSTTFLPSINEGTFGILRMVLYGVAFATLIGIRYFKKLVLSGKSQNQQLNQVYPYPALQKYSTFTIIALAMSESIGIYGLVLFFLGKNPVDLYLLILISAVALFMYRPKKEELIRLAREGGQDSSIGGTRT